MYIHIYRVCVERERELGNHKHIILHITKVESKTWLYDRYKTITKLVLEN